MKRTVMAAMMLSLLTGTAVALADPPQGYDHDHDRQDQRHDEHRDEHHDRGEHRGDMREIDTPFGPPSDSIFGGWLAGGRSIFFPGTRAAIASSRTS